ncbi:flavohemoglobin expression-modulating QEGLA motif protein [Shewanella sp. GXUN23E]|uniref:flavohemoglobin expression-modulating QEGLA motif protein n=1 Tax=Shewanella sp. GXUN23E TaxID=3422498 RepID=UPI003D7E5D01
MTPSEEKYCQHIRTLSDELVRIQKPIQILDAIKWPQGIEQAFLASPNELPPLPADYYQSKPLPFDHASLKLQLYDLRSAIVNILGKRDRLGQILFNTTEQYLLVLDMLEQRGKPAFGEFSKRLYGSSNDKLHGDRHSLYELGCGLSHLFSLPAARLAAARHEKVHSAQAAVDILTQKLTPYFHNDEVKVRLNDGIMSDAAVGGDTIKINSNASFSDADLNIYEVHEGWVHVGTTLNGRAQPYASWLSVGSPRVAATQEGLAVLLEMLTLSSTPGRARRISDRITAVNMAESGADFLEIYRHFVDQDISARDAYRITQRIFRGGMASGGSYFTKDISYVRGYVENVNFIRAAIMSGVPQLIPMLFIGKLAIEDIPTLYDACQQGIIQAPSYLPPMFADYSGLYAWFGFASGLANIDLKGVQRHFHKLFSELPHAQPSTVLEETEFG